MLETGFMQEYLFAGLRNRFQEGGSSNISEEGQLKGLTKVLASGGVPDSFRPLRWDILEYQPGEIVLGDGCVVATTTKSGPVSLLQSNNSWENIYLPISPSQVLAAGRDRISTPSASIINRASAKLSVSQFFCSTIDAAAPDLLSSLGQKAVILSEAEMAEMFADGWKGTGH